jgi:hypothetical protein
MDCKCKCIHFGHVALITVLRVYTSHIADHYAQRNYHCDAICTMLTYVSHSPSHWFNSLSARNSSTFK